MIVSTFLHRKGGERVVVRERERKRKKKKLEKDNGIKANREKKKRTLW